MPRKALLFVLTLAIAILLNSTCSVAEQEKPAPEPVQDTAAVEILPTPEATPPPATVVTVAETTPVPLKPEESVRITVSFAGDCTIGTDTSFGYKNSFPQVLAANNNDFSFFFSGVRHIFQTDDISVVNLETTLTTASKPSIKKFRFKGDPSYAGILKEGSIEMVNLANNHTMDYMQEGFDDTLDALEKAGVDYFGEGTVLYKTVKGVRIAFIGCTAWDRDVVKKLEESLEQAEKEAQITIVSLHWGRERVYVQDKDQVKLAHFCIDKGADAVIGHHPHVLQGVEYYRGRYIAYSLGNFCFGGNSNPSDKDTMIFRNEFELESGKLVKVGAEIIPCSISSARSINNYRPVVLEGTEKDRVLKKVKKSGW